MFESKNKGNDALLQQIADLQAQLAGTRARAELAEREPEAVNKNTHLGLWKSLYDENGNQTGAWFSEPRQVHVLLQAHIGCDSGSLRTYHPAGLIGTASDRDR